jgi:hypothetical protein
MSDQRDDNQEKTPYQPLFHTWGEALRIWGVMFDDVGDGRRDEAGLRFGCFDISDESKRRSKNKVSARASQGPG